MVIAVLCCTSSKQAAERAVTAGHMDVKEEARAGPQDAGVDPRLVEAQSSFEEARKLGAAGKYAEAITKAERALALREAALGSAHVEVAQCLNLTGEIYR